MTRAHEQASSRTDQLPDNRLVVYPTAAEFPNRRIPRRARILADRDHLTVIGPTGKTHLQLPVRGEGGIYTAVHITGALNLTGSTEDRRPIAEGLGGALDLRDHHQQILASIPLAQWWPNLADPARWKLAYRLQTSALEQTGLDGWSHTTGLPVKKANSATHPLVIGTGREARLHSINFTTTTLPSFVKATYLLAVATLILLAISVPLGPWLQVASGIVVLISAAVPVGWLAAQRLADWTSRPRPDVVLTPHPAGPATPRFRRTARVLTTADHIVFVDTMGAERWLPFHQPFPIATENTAEGTGERPTHTATGPVTSCAVLRRPGTDEPLAVEFRHPGGPPAAVLAWADWFAGPDGDTALHTFTTATGLTLTHDETDPPNHPETGQPMLPGLTTYQPLGRESVTLRLSRRPAPLMAASSISTVVGAALCAFFAQAADSRKLAAATLGAIALAVSVLPWLIPTLRRIWWDRER